MSPGADALSDSNEGSGPVQLTTGAGESEYGVCKRLHPKSGGLRLSCQPAPPPARCRFRTQAVTRAPTSHACATSNAGLGLRGQQHLLVANRRASILTDPLRGVDWRHETVPFETALFDAQRLSSRCHLSRRRWGRTSPKRSVFGQASVRSETQCQVRVRSPASSSRASAAAAGVLVRRVAPRPTTAATVGASRFRAGCV